MDEYWNHFCPNESREVRLTINENVCKYCGKELIPEARQPLQEINQYVTTDVVSD